MKWKIVQDKDSCNHQNSLFTPIRCLFKLHKEKYHSIITINEIDEAPICRAPTCPLRVSEVDKILVGEPGDDYYSSKLDERYDFYKKKKVEK